MYDAVKIADDLSEADALTLQGEQAAKLKDMGEAEYGRCIGVRHAGYGRWAVFVGMQDGAPLKEWPKLREATKKPRRTRKSRAGASTR